MTGQPASSAKSEITYGHRRTIDLPYDQAVQHTREALQAEGFGVLCEIDIKEKLKEKLGVDFRKYVILGACNPPLAHRTLQEEIEIGLLLPCNVIVYEADKPGRSVVVAVDAKKMLSVAGGSDTPLNSIATEVDEKLQRVLSRL